MHSLKFITFDCDGSISNHWNPARSGNYAADCAAGREYAGQLAASGRGAEVLPWVIRAMPRGDAFGGCEIGFLSAICA